MPGNSLEKILKIKCGYFYLYLSASLTNSLSTEECHFLYTEVDFGSGLSTGSILMKKKTKERDKCMATVVTAELMEEEFPLQ